MDHSILILLFYYNRPNMVKNALRSIKLVNNYYKNWILAFHDDCSDVPGEPIVREILADELDKIKFYKSEMSRRDKIKLGSPLGKKANEILKEVKTDIAIMLCDDDAIHPDYFVNLNNYFSANMDIKSCYSNVIAYNPMEEPFENALNRDIDLKSPLNRFNHPLQGSNLIDASQVAWRTICNIEYDVWFPEYCEKNHDAAFYKELNEKCGDTHYTGFISQFKGHHRNQLGRLLSFPFAVNNILRLDQSLSK